MTKQTHIGESKKETSVKDFEDRMRAEGRCACGRPLAKVKNATFCEHCRNDILGDLSAA